MPLRCESLLKSPCAGSLIRRCSYRTKSQVVAIPLAGFPCCAAAAFYSGVVRWAVSPQSWEREHRGRVRCVL
uniref:Uncharacterized protein n=1 Tax=Arundo donax TaxID=35708 RepID=A0A0A9APC6_ARUDO